ncbi:uncharacterized protein N7515_008881 [Penicillium bovifimosum]|uniref:Zn(2)-C6 fungal-type domain-containing protein n=1 Tax=Penicillium bovifimosum TaxID=126998 RepID=A0A9W9GNW4_9EURO|nr:uncharacterized protein N7515_008881 [Penicillium bovifimosum]KAJ5125056.1 hypothetical protein N7515_008881 [Penicillium bovifimosum]
MCRLPKKGKKACTIVPCSRCRKRNLECTIDDSFTREHKRRRYIELEHENEQWRQQLQSSQQLITNSVPVALPTAAASIAVSAVIKSDAHLGDPRASTLSYPQYQLPLSGSTQVAIMGDDDGTKLRALKSVTLAGEEIDELYQNFFRHYASFLPILDAQTRPDVYYAQSPFLFWAILGVSSRSYGRNPTLQSALAQEVTEMAFMSVLSTCAPWHIIQGLLILLTWPFPKDNRPDVTFPMSGMLLHVAMQNGFHIPMSSHEFSRVKIPAPSELDMVRRSELWAHCVLVYQRSCLIKGQSPRNLVTMAQDETQRQVLFDMIAPHLVQKLRCQEVLGKCCEAVLENGVRAMTLEQELALDVLLRRFEGDVDDIALQAVVEDERYYLLLCRMAIQSFHFYKTQTIATSGCLPRLIVTACNLVDYVQALADRTGYLFMVPVQITFGLLLASMSLLRILKSDLASSGLDTSRARATFFAAINLAKQMSTDRSDTAAKIVTVLTQLWNSSKAFRKADGSDYTALRIRSRLILSQILDSVWWWRDEFDPKARAEMRGCEFMDNISSRGRSFQGIEVGHATVGTDPGREPSSRGNVQNLSTSRRDDLYMNEDYLTNFEWLSDEIFSFPLDSSYNLA